MSKFLMQVSLTQDGVRGLAKDGGSKRKQVAERFFASVGGKLEALYFAFGDKAADMGDVLPGLIRIAEKRQTA